MLADIKKALGLNNDEFDSIINNYVSSAKKDLEMVGIAKSIVEADSIDPLIYSAILSYVQSKFDLNNSELFQNSYDLQKNFIRRISSYMEKEE